MKTQVIAIILYCFGSHHIRHVACSPRDNGLYFIYSTWPKDKVEKQEIYTSDDEGSTSIDHIILDGELGTEADPGLHESKAAEEDLDFGESNIMMSILRDNKIVENFYEEYKEISDDGWLLDGQKIDYICSEIKCDDKHDPVCDSSGNTHNSFCIMEKMACLVPKENIQMKHPGPCGFKGWMPDMSPTSPPLECPLECPNTYEPVCDSNGNTHPNQCILRYVACMLPLMKITISINGECENNDANAQADEPTTISEVCSGSDIPCPDTEEPVCDIKGNTHRSFCDMEKIACLVPNENIEMKYPGPCDALGWLSKPTARHLDCSLKCPDQNYPICDNRGNTHKNPCTLMYVACMLPLMSIEISHPGECGKSLEEVLASVDETISSQKCPDFCVDRLEYVCDTNGNTHDNICLMFQLACLVPNENIQMQYPGPCGSHGLRSKANTKSGIDCKLDCPDVSQPLCDNRGNTHKNPCLLAYVSCMLPLKKIVMIHPGECGSIVLDEPIMAVSPGSTVRTINCDLDCSDFNKAVCDNRGETHNSHCKMVVEACRFPKEKIVMSYPGECRETKDGDKNSESSLKMSRFLNYFKK